LAAYLLFITIAAPLLAGAGYWQLPIPAQGEPPADYHPLARDPNPQSCALCHAEQFRQWQQSLHARAFSKGVAAQLPAFEEAVQGDCLECHAPRSEQLDLWLGQGIGSTAQIHGVDCATCHLRRHRRHSPLGKTQTPHGPVIAVALFRDPEFCSPCHQFQESGERLNGKLLENTYQEWLASSHAAANRTCQSCHMPDGSHEFKGIHDPEMTRKGLKVEARRTVQGAHFRAWNDGAGHALPTYATPRIKIVMKPEGNNKPHLRHVIQRRLEWDEENGWSERSDTRLQPGQSVELNLELADNQATEITVSVEPDAYYHEWVYPTLLRLIGDDLLPAERNILNQAMQESGDTEYLLYILHCDRWMGSEAVCIQKQ
jgi:hypothetical protein